MIRISRQFINAALIAVVSIFIVCNAQADGTVVDALNESGNPPATGDWSAHTYGIVYTPSSSYLLERVEAKWNDAVVPLTITIEVYDGNPNSGGVKLTEGSFSQTAAGWQGADLNTPVNFVAGEDYFIGFGNTTGVMSRFFDDADDGAQFTVWWGNSAGTYDVEDTGPGWYYDPIWRLIGVSHATPVPTLSTLGLSMLVLLLTGLGWVFVRHT
jgi:hypothetical protein